MQNKTAGHLGLTGGEQVVDARVTVVAKVDDAAAGHKQQALKELHKVGRRGGGMSSRRSK